LCFYLSFSHFLTQIAALVQPEHMSATGRAVANLGRGMNSTGLVRLTNYQVQCCAHARCVGMMMMQSCMAL
jgi:hypothetical protein